MVRGLYTAYTGMINEQKRLDVISNNLANSATVGFKEENMTNKAFDEVLAIKIRDGSEAYTDRAIGTMSLGVELGEIYTNFKQGSMRQTENTYDLAIEGKGFFAVNMVDRDGNETTRYTRNGSFKLTQEGYVVDEDGNHLLSSGSPLQIPVNATNVAIEKDGSVFADGELIDKIELVDFEDYNYLKKYGDNMYEPVEGAAAIPTYGRIMQGYTEQSNVNVVSEMVEMITISRAYEANQKAIRTIDGMLDKSVNQIGKV